MSHVKSLINLKKFFSMSSEYEISETQLGRGNFGDVFQAKRRGKD